MPLYDLTNQNGGTEQLTSLGFSFRDRLALFQSKKSREENEFNINVTLSVTLMYAITVALSAID